MSLNQRCEALVASTALPVPGRTQQDVENDQLLGLFTQYEQTPFYYPSDPYDQYCLADLHDHFFYLDRKCEGIQFSMFNLRIVLSDLKDYIDHYFAYSGFGQLSFIRVDKPSDFPTSHSYYFWFDRCVMSKLKSAIPFRFNQRETIRLLSLMLPDDVVSGIVPFVFIKSNFDAELRDHEYRCKLRSFCDLDGFDQVLLLGEFRATNVSFEELKCVLVAAKNRDCLKFTYDLFNSYCSDSFYDSLRRYLLDDHFSPDFPNFENVYVSSRSYSPTHDVIDREEVVNRVNYANECEPIEPECWSLFSFIGCVWEFFCCILVRKPCVNATQSICNFCETSRVTFVICLWETVHCFVFFFKCLIEFYECVLCTLGIVIDFVFKPSIVWAYQGHFRRRERDWRGEDSGYSVHDGNELFNIRFVKHMYARGNPSLNKMHGTTKFQGVVFPFPVYCDEKTFKRCFENFRQLDNYQKRLLMVHNEWSFDTMEVFKPAFSSVLSVLPAFADLSVTKLFRLDEKTFGDWTIFALAFQLCSLYYGVDTFYLQAILLPLVHFLNLQAASLPYVVAEELLTEWLGPAPIIILETIPRLGATDAASFILGFMHFVEWYFLPLPFRIIFHHAWNKCAMKWHVNASQSVDPEAWIIEDLSYFLDILLKIKRQQNDLLLLSLGQRYSSVKRNLVSLLNLNSIDELDFQELSDAVFSPQPLMLHEGDEEEKEEYLIAPPFEGSKYDFIFSWIPKEFSRSPTFSRIAGFVVLLLQSRWVESWEPMRKIAKYLTSDTFTVQGDMMSTIFGALKGCWQGVSRCVSTGDFKAFFDMPRDVAFEVRASDLLYRRADTSTVAQRAARLAEARDLINSRLYLRNDSKIDRLVERLKLFCMEEEKFRDSVKSRVPPVVIFLGGKSGTGKTTLIDVLVNFLSVRDKVPRFMGDLEKINIDDKYMLRPNANTKARYLILNEAPAITTDFPKQDLMPFDLLCQKVIDTFTLSFRAAAIEDKGQVLNDVKYFIITSNAFEFVCPGETEKLQRRFEDGILVDVQVVDSSGRSATHAEFSRYSQEQRNDAWRFVPLSVKCADKHVSFTRKYCAYPLVKFLAYLESRITYCESVNKKIFESFQEGAETCPCGIVKTLHYSVKDDDSLLQGQGDNERTFRCLSERCDASCDTTCSYVNRWQKLESQMLGVQCLDARGLICVLLVLIALFFNKEAWIRAFFDLLMSERLLRLQDRIGQRLIMWDAFQDYVREADYLTARTRFIIHCKRNFYRIQRMCKKYAWAFAALSAAGFALVLKKHFEKHEALIAHTIFKEQVDKDSMTISGYGVMSNFPLEKRREWNKPDENIRTVEVTTVGVASVDLETMCRKQTEVVPISFTGGEKAGLKTTANVVFIAPEWIMINKHYIVDAYTGKPFGKVIIFDFHGIGYSHSTSEFRGVSNCELCFLKHNFPVVYPSLIRFFPKKCVSTAMDIVRVGVTDRYEGVAHPSKFLGGKYPSLEWYGDKPRNGLCGELTIGKLGADAIVCGAVAYMNDRGGCGCSLVSQELFNEAIKSDLCPFVETVELIGMPFYLEPLSERSELRNVSSPFLAAVGTVPGATQSFRTSIRRSRLYDDVSPFLTKEFTMPKRTHVMFEGAYKSSFTTTFANINLGCDLQEFETDYVINMMIERIASVQKVRERGVNLHPTDLESAMFGNEALGIMRMDFRTSIGPLLREAGFKNKYDFFEELDEEGKYKFKEEVLAQVMKYVDSIESGSAVAPFSQMVNKDEVRPVDKISQAKIRLFCVLCCAFNLYLRMLFMPLIVYLLQYREDSECYGAMNAGSVEWNDLANRMRRSGFFNFDMDFSTFDMSHGSQIFYAAAKFFRLLALRLGYTEKEANCVYIAMIGFRWQIGKYMMDIFMKFKGMPSGVIFTLIMNSFVNSFLLRVAYLRLVGDGDFDNKVNTANVGDDNINAVDESLYEKFNMVTIAVVYRRLGYVATPANKSGQIAASLPFSELTFVKRKFAWSKELGVYVAPIEWDSIYKGLCFENREAGISPVQRLEDMAGNCQREAFLHGRPAFNKFQKDMRPIFEKHQLYFEELDFDKLKEEFVEKKFRTYAL
jgi:hypothetical protein